MKADSSFMVEQVILACLTVVAVVVVVATLATALVNLR